MNALRQHVRALERAARRGEPLDGQALDALRARAQEAAPLPPPLAARIAALERQAALQARPVPTGVLDDLVETVRAQVAEEADDPARYWRRAGLSHSFLDAPRHLAVWRRMAVAALVLVGVGAGALLNGTLRFSADAPGSTRPADPYAGLLEPYEAGRTARPRTSRFVRSISSPVRMVSDGVRPPPAHAANTTVVFPMRDLSSRNVTDMLDGLAIPDMGAARLVEDN